MKRVLLAIILLSFLGGCTWTKSRLLERKEETITVWSYDVDTMIDRPMEDVFKHISIWENVGKMVPYADLEPPAEPMIRGVGDYMEGRISILGVSIPWRMVVVEWEPARRIRYAMAGSLRGFSKVTLEAVGDQTHMIMSSHVYYLPDTIVKSVFNTMISSGTQDIQWEPLAKRSRELTMAYGGRPILLFKAELEGKDPDSVSLDTEPTSNMFVDSYFMAQEIFSLPSEELYKRLDSIDDLNSLVPGIRIEPVGDSPRTFEGPGHHYTLTATEGLETPLVYDVVTMQVDPPRETRLFLLSHNVCMEWDFIVAPTLKGGKVFALFIVDHPDVMEGRALEVIIHASKIDGMVQQSLTGLKKEIERR